MPLLPRLACVIPYFQGEDTIGRTLDSVLASELCEEIIVVDDASPRGLRHVLAPRHLDAERSGRLKLVGLSDNRGQAAARNTGAALATSTWLSFLDQDDEILPACHWHAMSCLESFAQAAAVEMNAEVVRGAATLIDEHDPRHRLILDAVPWNVVVHRAVFWVCGGFPTATIFRTDAAGEDMAFKAALKTCFNVPFLAVPGVRHHVRPGSATDRFLARTAVEPGGRVAFKHRLAVEEDGTLAQAILQHVQQAKARQRDLARMTLRA